MEAQTIINEMITKARVAQKTFEKYSQEQVDACVREIAWSVYNNYEELAKREYNETGMGNLSDKLSKNRVRPTVFWWHLKGKKSRGIIRRLDDKGLVELAKPMGVVGCIAPVTGAIVTPLHNMMCALKCGNSVIFSPHPAAVETSKYYMELVNAALKKTGAPENLIQMVENPTIELSRLVMESCDISIATGGPGLVKAAYSSGKPSYGVGAGNDQCLVDRGRNFDEVAQMIIVSKTVENGIPCGSEQYTQCHRNDLESLIAAFERNGAYVLRNSEDIDKIRKTIFPNHEQNKAIVGRVPSVIAKQAGITIPENTRLLVILVDTYGEEEDLAKEKLFPVMCLRAYDTWEDAVTVAQANLEVMGKGHSCMIHSDSQAHIEYAAENIDVCRFGINQSSSKCVGGTMLNCLAPTGTVGCGTWGNNTLSENLDYIHLMNVSRIVYERKDAVVPSDEEVWG